VKQGAAPIIAGFLGAIGGIVAAKSTEESTERKLFLELRIKHADETAKHFGKYVEAQLRLKIMCDNRDAERAGDKALEASGHVTEAQRTKNLDIYDMRQKAIDKVAVEERRPARDGLAGEFGVLRLYFRPQVTTKVNEFVKWEHQYRSALCGNLPESQEWIEYEAGILDLIRSEIIPAGTAGNRRWYQLWSKVI